MARYRLLEPFYLDERLIEKGTIVGDGTPIPWVDRYKRPIPPSYEFMEPLDDEARAEVAKVREAKKMPPPMDPPPVADPEQAMKGLPVHKKVQQARSS